MLTSISRHPKSPTFTSSSLMPKELHYLVPGPGKTVRWSGICYNFVFLWTPVICQECFWIHPPLIAAFISTPCYGYQNSLETSRSPHHSSVCCRDAYVWMRHKNNDRLMMGVHSSAPWPLEPPETPGTAVSHRWGVRVRLLVFNGVYWFIVF